MEKPDIKIFVSSRIDLESDAFKSEILVPVRCGATFDTRKNPQMIGDDTGENISDKRLSFCEMTVQYWAWKNAEADYYGLFHYRRFFNFSGESYLTNAYGTVCDEFINEKSAKKYGLIDKKIQKLVRNYDMIVPEAMDISKFPEKYKSVQEQWKSVQYLHEKDLNAMLDVIARLQPTYFSTAKKYLLGEKAYFCAMHIMKKELFQEYCTWLYPILFELENEIDVSTYSVEGQRTIGHLAERLLGIFITYVKENRPELRIMELQTVLFTKPERLPVHLEPAFKEIDRTVPVVLASSQAFSHVCAVTIASVIQNSCEEKNYDIVVLNSGIRKEDGDRISGMAKGLENVSIRFFNVQGAVDAYNLKVQEHLSIETYYRFLILDVLYKYNKVLYLDSDLVCDKDVAVLYETDIEGYLLAAVRDPDMCGQMNLSKKTLEYVENKLKMDKPFDYFQAGVLLLNTAEMRKLHDVKEWLKIAEERFKYADQDVLNRHCQGHVKFISMQWNVLTDCNNYRVPVLVKAAPASVNKAYFDARKDPYIVHYAGFQKPWNLMDMDNAEYFWKYAKYTPYYELLQNQALVFSMREYEEKIIANRPIGFRHFIKLQAKRLCPRGTIRYRIAKKIQTLYRKVFRKG